VSIFLRLFSKKVDPNSVLSRKAVLLNQFDFLLDTLENSKFDIVYMENLKQPLTPDERVYFTQQIDRIESAKNVLLWMRSNVISNEKFWKKFLKW